MKFLPCNMVPSCAEQSAVQMQRRGRLMTMRRPRLAKPTGSDRPAQQSVTKQPAAQRQANKMDFQRFTAVYIQLSIYVKWSLKMNHSLQTAVLPCLQNFYQAVICVSENVFTISSQQPLRLAVLSACVLWQKLNKYDYIQHALASHITPSVN